MSMVEIYKWKFKTEQESFPNSVVYDLSYFICSIIVENVAEQCVTSVVKMNLPIQSWVLKILFACVMNVMKPSQMMSKLESWSIESW